MENTRASTPAKAISPIDWPLGFNIHPTRNAVGAAIMVDTYDNAVSPEALPIAPAAPMTLLISKDIPNALRSGRSNDLAEIDSKCSPAWLAYRAPS
jgi:hypothetical protein